LPHIYRLHWARYAADPVFLEEFFALLSPCDYIPGVFGVLDRLNRDHEKDAQAYRSLVLAFALVYDSAPPPDWPHWQAPEAVLPRRLPDASAAFAFLVKEDREGRTLQKLSRLPASELKFVVDIGAPLEDLAWSRSVIDVPLDRFQQVYFLIKYRRDRIKNNVPIWPGQSYALPQILAQGGICVDQAFFACQVGKARGVPTLFFSGIGKDGRHAWFGFLDAKQEWHLDAGRYAEQRFAAGLARDPQTWAQISDHTLSFMAERFQSQANAQRARVHLGFATEFLTSARLQEAQSAARAAIRAERRLLDSYLILSSAMERRGAANPERESVWREAVVAFQKAPELERYFTSLLVDSLRKRGQTSQAAFEETKLIKKAPRRPC
jgi:hypothetical protein